MKIDHKEQYTDFEEQFVIDENIDDRWGSKEIILFLIN